MIRIVDEQRLGFVASIDTDGTPNLSPKGTFIVLDDKHLAYLDIRSPGTRRNIAERHTLEINFVDAFVRKGYRFKGTACSIPRDTPAFNALLSRFERYGELAGKAHAIVTVAVERALPLITPAYERGLTELELRRRWTRHFREIQPGQRFVE